jgi:hypothetical protein
MSVNKVTWKQVGEVEEPGRYNYRFGWLTITAEDIAIWEQFPLASFTLVRQVASPDEFRLGSFDCRRHVPHWILATRIGPRWRCTL